MRQLNKHGRIHKTTRNIHYGFTKPFMRKSYITLHLKKKSTHQKSFGSKMSNVLT